MKKLSENNTANEKNEIIQELKKITRSSKGEKTKSIKKDIEQSNFDTT
ncbi:MAG: hypothetical protein WCG25_04950 [bacterium]